MEFTLAQVIEATGAKPSLEVRAQARVTGWSIDSRTIQAGDLFFAIKGDVHDGHAFVAGAIERGAAAAVVCDSFRGSAEQPLLRVPDTLQALQRLAAYGRKSWGGQVVGVTGSAGKTSTKDIIAELLATKFKTGKTAGNFNNHIGLPLSILRLPADAGIAVLEMGMNHAGEIRDLAAIAQPQTGVVTNVGYAHFEAFSSIEGIAAAKRELIEALPRDGVAVLNADDERVIAFRDSHGGRTVTYGFSEDAEIRAIQVEHGSGAAAFTVHGVRFKSSLAGRHGVLNVLAGLAVAHVFGLELSALAKAVEDLRPAKMRGEKTTRAGITILNDSYNSNPEAARNMIDLLRGEPAKRRIAVLGEMLELGRMAEELHRELGNYVASAGVDVLIGVSGASQFMVDAAVSKGLARSAFFFPDPEAAGTFLKKFVREGDAILFKGSRGTHVERALARIEE